MNKLFFAIIMVSFVATSVLAAFVMSADHAHASCLATTARQMECPTGIASMTTAAFFHIDFIKTLSIAVFSASRALLILLVFALMALRVLIVFIPPRRLESKKHRTYAIQQRISGWLAHGKQLLYDWLARLEMSPTNAVFYFFINYLPYYEKYKKTTEYYYRNSHCGYRVWCFGLACSAIRRRNQ